MRDLLLLLILVGAALPSILHPWIGALLWTWISIMNPHRLSWNAFEWPVGILAAGVTLLGLLITRDERRAPVYPLTVLIGLFGLWMLITTAFSLHPENAWPLMDRVWKILLMLIITLALLHTRRQIELFALVITASLAFFGIKGGLFTLTTGGEHRVWGPPGTFIADNNELALALVMTLPLLRYFQLQTNRRSVKILLLGVMALCCLAIAGSHSRGAVVAAGAMAVFLWRQAGCKFLPGAFMVIMATTAMAFMPSVWETRMASMQSYEADQSVQGRFSAWQTARNVASERLTGGGFGMWTREVFTAYNPEARSVHAAHSIYFQVLGEHGVIGLLLFLSIWLITWVGAARLARAARASPDTQWLAHLAGMVQVSLVAYAVGGSFYSLAYFDLPYDLAALVVLGQQWLRRHAARPAPA